MNNSSDAFDMTHPLDDFARMRKNAIDTLMDTTTDLGLSFTIEDNTFIVTLPPESDDEPGISDPDLD